MNGPSPESKYPFDGLNYDLKTTKRIVFLKNFITNKNIIVGDYTYYDDPNEAENFEIKNAPYLYNFSKEKLIICKFCAISTDVKFITASANHKLDGFSTYPFSIMGHGWEKDYDLTLLPNKGDTIVGNDVWFGYDSTIMPAVKIGDGAIIGAKAVVTKDVPPYCIAAGNPATIVKKRFNDEIISELLKIKWRDWSKGKISRNIKAIIGADLNLLKQAK